MERHPLEQAYDVLRDGLDKAKLVGVFVLHQLQGGGWSDLPEQVEANITHFGKGNDDELC